MPLFTPMGQSEVQTCESVCPDRASDSQDQIPESDESRIQVFLIILPLESQCRAGFHSWPGIGGGRWEEDKAEAAFVFPVEAKKELLIF